MELLFFEKKGNNMKILIVGDVFSKLGREALARNIKRIAEETGTTIYILPLSMDEIGNAVAKRAGVLTVCDSGFSKKIKELLDNGEHKA